MQINNNPEPYSNTYYRPFEKLKLSIENKIIGVASVITCLALPAGSLLLGIGLKETKVGLIVSGSLLLVTSIGTLLIAVRNIVFVKNAPIIMSDLEKGLDSRISPLLDKPSPEATPVTKVPPPYSANFF